MVVTGGSRGVGAALVETCLAKGARVAACARTEPPFAGAFARAVDVAQPLELGAFAEAAIEEIGPIDLWVNNAALIAPIGPLREQSDLDLARLLNVNVLGTLIGTCRFARHLRATGRAGVLLNLSSGASRKAYPGWATYCASKAAVERLTEAIALEEGPLLRAHSVAPGVVDSEMQRAIRDSSVEAFPQVERFRQRHVDGGLRSAEDVAADLLAIAFDPDCPIEGVCVDLPLPFALR